MPLSKGRRRLLIGIAIGIVVLLSIVFFGGRALLFPGKFRTPAADAGADVAGLQRLYIEIEGGRVEAWFLPGDGVDDEHPGPLVIYAHGNGGLIDQAPPALQGYRRRGISVLLPEYRGYGRSAGSPSESALADDFVVFYDTVIRRPDVDERRVVLHGRSLGGGVASSLAKRRPVAAIVLHSTFTSIRDVAWDKYFMPSILVLDPFDNVELVSRYEGPILIVHGTDDQLIPVAHAEALHQAAPNSELLLLPGGHNDFPRDWDALMVEIDRFLVGANVLPG